MISLASATAVFFLSGNLWPVGGMVMAETGSISHLAAVSVQSSSLASSPTFIILLLAIAVGLGLLLANLRTRKKLETAKKEWTEIDREHRKALTISENRLNLVINASQDAIFLMGKDHFLDCNKGLLDLFGLDDEEVFFKNASRRHFPALSTQRETFT